MCSWFLAVVFCRLPAAPLFVYLLLQSLWRLEPLPFHLRRRSQGRLGPAPKHPAPPTEKKPNNHTHAHRHRHTLCPSTTAVNGNKDVVVAWKRGFQGVPARPCVSSERCMNVSSPPSVPLKTACTSALQRRRRWRRRRADDLLPPQRHQVAEGVLGDTRAGRADRDSKRRFIES